MRSTATVPAASGRDRERLGRHLGRVQAGQEPIAMGLTMGYLLILML